MDIFFFSRSLFSQLSTTLARKVMKRPIVFIIYFQNLPQIVAINTISINLYEVQKSYLSLLAFAKKCTYSHKFINQKNLLTRHRSQNIAIIYHRTSQNQKATDNI